MADYHRLGRHRFTPQAHRQGVGVDPRTLAATAGALLGAWLGVTATSGLFALVTTTIGAAAAGNLALIAVSLFRERSARAAMATVAVNSATDSDDVAPHPSTSV